MCTHDLAAWTKITPDDVEAALGLRVRPEQEKNVEPVAVPPAEACVV
ncbi:hypothetical protein [Streptomyces sp. WMMC940]|nr:hypothetical protein [Streptomyces sp. WMMC940]MCZ7459490.1 hypothetical protein [Streptomyces sp. WMMC940]